MINTLRLARRWQEAGLAPEQAGAMVEALQEELDQGAATKADLRILQAELERAMAHHKTTVLWALVGMFVALTGVIITVARLT